MRRSKLGAIAGLSIALVSASAAAQPPSGDLVFSVFGPSGGVYSTSTSLRSPAVPIRRNFSAISCQTGYNNAWIQAGHQDGRVFRVNFDGSTWAIRTLPNGVNAADLDQDASMMMATADGVLKMHYSGIRVSTVLRMSSITGICRNTKTGNFAITRGGASPAILGMTPGGSVHTLRQLSIVPTGICYVPDLDRYAISLQSTAVSVYYMRPDGILMRAQALPAVANAITYDENRRRLFAATSFPGAIYELHPMSLDVIRSRTFVPTGSITGLDVWGDQQISLVTSGIPGTRAGISVRFPRSPGKKYCLAVSRGLRPGVSIPSTSQQLNLEPDDLLLFTACGERSGSLTTGFTGTTNALTGQATADVLLPAGLPRWLTLYVSGVAVNTNLPGWIDVGNTEPIQIR